MENITTWQSGHFVDCYRYKHWTEQQEHDANYEEGRKVRPSTTGNAICLCNTQKDAAWVAERLNLAAVHEQRTAALRTRIAELEAGAVGEMTTDELMTVIDAVVDEHQMLDSQVIAEEIMRKFSGRMVCKHIW